VDLEQRGVPEGLERLVVGHAVAAAGDDGELVGAGRVPVDGRVDGAARRVGVALHQRVVALVDGPLAEGVLEDGVRPLALGDHHAAARADVEAVDDALPLLAPLVLTRWPAAASRR
jgi:hypothetical protein